MNSRPAHRVNPHSASTMAMSDGPGRCATRPAPARFSSFAQDFNHEHSGAARAVSAKPATARSIAHQDSPSPNCIYLG